MIPRWPKTAPPRDDGPGEIKPAPVFVSQDVTLPGGLRARTVKPPSVAEAMDGIERKLESLGDPEILGRTMHPAKLAPGCTRTPAASGAI